jgi:hypothetical protein
MLVSRIENIKFGVKNRIDNYTNDNSDEIGFAFIGNFRVNHFCVVAISYEDFMNYGRPIKR